MRHIRSRYHQIYSDEDIRALCRGWDELQTALSSKTPETSESPNFDRFGLEERELVLERLFGMEAKVRVLQRDEQALASSTDVDYDAIQKMFGILETSAPIEIGHGIDFDLELRERSVVVSETVRPALFLLFVTIPGDQGHGLDKENHGWGYHLHYVSSRKGRTNVVFTFNPNELTTKDGSDRLYWFPHGSGKVKTNPGRFKFRRKESIHSRSIKFLFDVKKSKFMSPPRRKSKVLYP